MKQINCLCGLLVKGEARKMRGKPREKRECGCERSWKFTTLFATSKGKYGTYVMVY